MNQKPVISVIIAVYNGKKTLQRCIDSVSNQTYPHRELIIIDGNSTDGTVDILRANNDKIAYWKSEPDNGIYHAWNKALDHVKGDWICFLGSDDYFWQVDVLEHVREHLVKASSVGVRVVYGKVAIITRQGEVLLIHGRPWKEVRCQITDHMCVPHPGMMHHKSIFEIYGKFDESFRIAGDYDLLLKVLKPADAYFITSLILVGKQHGGISSNPKHALTVIWESARARLNNRSRVITFPWVRRYYLKYLRRLIVIYWKEIKCSLISVKQKC